MRIGVDMDDTICRTSEIVHDRLGAYAEMIHLNPLDIMNDEELKSEFFSQYLEDIYLHVDVKKSVVDVLRRLKSKGNEIIIITAREDGFSKDYTAESITKKWLDEHGILYDQIIPSTYGVHRAQICKEKKIDLMIDDDPYNFKMIRSVGIRCLLFDDHGRYELKEDYATSWFEVEKYIERNFLV